MFLGSNVFTIRTQMTESHDIQRQLMRMHGFAIQASLLSEYPCDDEISRIVSGTLMSDAANCADRYSRSSCSGRSISK